MNDSNVIKNIIDNTAVTKAGLAQQLEVSRQYIGQLYSGVRSLSPSLREKLKVDYAEYLADVAIPNELTSVSVRKYRKDCGYTRAGFAKVLHISEALLTKIENGDRGISEGFAAKFRTYIGNESSELITLKYDRSTGLKSNFRLTPLNCLTVSVKIDRKLLPEITPHLSRVIALDDDSCEPAFPKGSRIILDESYKDFINGEIFAFMYESQCYIRKVNIVENKVKCIALNKEYDTFYIHTKGESKILGRVVPCVRF